MTKTMIFFLFHFLPIYNLCKHYCLYCSPYSIHPLYPQHRLLCFKLFCNSLFFCYLCYQNFHPLMRFAIHSVQMFIKLPLQHQHLIVRFSLLLEICFPEYFILPVMCFFVLRQFHIRQMASDPSD